MRIKKLIKISIIGIILILSLKIPISIYAQPIQSHSPILIENDEDLAIAASSGLGSENDPYIIENLLISPQYMTSGIIINNTSKFLNIINCTIFRGDTGISISNASNISIKNCTFFNNHYAFFIIDGWNLEIQNCSVLCNWFGGIYIKNGENIKIYKNLIDNNGNSGLRISDSGNLNISWNCFNDTVDDSYAIKILGTNPYPNHIYLNAFLEVIERPIFLNHSGVENFWTDGRFGNYYIHYNGSTHNDTVWFEPYRINNHFNVTCYEYDYAPLVKSPWDYNPYDIDSTDSENTDSKKNINVYLWSGVGLSLIAFIGIIIYINNRKLASN